MENEENKELDLDKNEEGAAEEEGEAKPKPKLTAEQIEGIKRRQFTKLAKELGVELPKAKPEPSEEKIEKGFDYGELTYLEVKGVADEDHAWILEGMEHTGKNLKDYLKSDWVQKELKERNTARSADRGVPAGTNRSQGGALIEDTVEYYVASGKQPPSSKPLEFRKKVLEARLKKEGNDEKFASDSLVSPF